MPKDYALATVFSTRPPLTPSTHNDIRIIRPPTTPRKRWFLGQRSKFQYDCGHYDTRYTIDAYGEEIPSNAFKHPLSHCGDCRKVLFERESIRCANTGRLILPGDMVALLVYPFDEPAPPYTRVVVFGDHVSAIAIAETGLDLCGFLKPGRTFFSLIDQREHSTCLASEI